MRRILASLILSVALCGQVRNPRTTPDLQPIKRVKPEYPKLAKMARIDGTATVELIVGTDGKVRIARVLSGAHPLLAGPALTAASQWEWGPVTEEFLTWVVIRFSWERQ